MGIENLLAQGFDTRPAGMRANALMQVEAFKQRQQQNALMQMQMQAAQEQAAAQKQNALMQQQASQQRDAELSRIQGGGQFDPLALLRAGVPEKQIEFLANRQNLGRPEVARVEERRGADGNPERVMIDRFGNPVGGALPQAVKMQMENLGGSVQPVNPYTQTAPLKRTQTPDSVASNAVTMRGQNMSDARAREALAQSRLGGGNPRTGPMSVTLQKELLESDDAVQSSASVVRALEAAKAQNSKAYDGYFAKQRAQLVSNTTGSAAADATIDIDNLMTGQGLDQMKAIFGAAPTEGERKILMDMQASVDKTPKQREAIMDRAIAAAKRRADYAANKAKAIRDGSYLTEGIQAPTPAAEGGKTINFGDLK